MRNWIFLTAFLSSFLCLGQNKVAFQSITVLDQDTSTFKVILISAPWCGICKANHEMIENSDAIFDAVSSSFSFFEMKNDCTDPIEFDNKTFHFVQRGPSVGEHQFIEYLVESGETVYPTFVLLNGENEKIGTYQGFVNESDWLEIFGTILNHLESPDSVTSN